MRIDETTVGYMVHAESGCAFLILLPLHEEHFSDGLVEQVSRNEWYRCCREWGIDANKVIADFRKEHSN